MNEYNPFDNYLKSLKNCKFLTAEEERNLIKKAQAGDKKASDRVVEANLRFVVNRAKKMKEKGCRADIEELVAAGNIGLTIAVSKFDLKKGTRFITFAAFWIKAEMNAEAGKVNSIHLPHNCQVKLPKVLAAEESLPKNMDYSAKCQAIARRVGATKKTIEAILEATASISSLDSVVADDEDANLYSFIGDNSACDPLDEIIENEMNEKLNKVLRKLPDDERMVIENHYGLNGHRKMSFEEIAGKWGKNITREGIRQKELKAIKKFRESENSMLFDGMLDIAV